MSAETAEALRRAKALINTPEKWIKGRLTNGRGCFCSVGAIVAVHPGTRLVRAIEAHLPHAFGFLAGFNDDLATTHADVMALFDRAIAAEEADQ